MIIYVCDICRKRFENKEDVYIGELSNSNGIVDVKYDLCVCENCLDKIDEKQQREKR